MAVSCRGSVQSDLRMDASNRMRGLPRKGIWNTSSAAAVISIRSSRPTIANGSVLPRISSIRSQDGREQQDEGVAAERDLEHEQCGGGDQHQVEQTDDREWQCLAEDQFNPISGWTRATG